MDAEVEAGEELRALVAGFRTHLEARARSGLLGVPLGASRPAPASARAAPAAAERASAGPETGAPSGPPAGAKGATSAEDDAAGPRGAAGLQLVRESLGDCRRCKLHEGRRNIVFGVGNPDADLVFVGEGPGADEDAQGEPFVGAAGQLLNKMIAAMGYAREDVYICNVVKCRPPYNRNPEPDEVASCEPFLKAQLAALRPRIIVALGKFAAQLICRTDTPISRLRGTFRSYQGIPVMPTYHPAFLLRTPEAKRQAWADLQAVMASLERLGIRPPRARNQ